MDIADTLEQMRIAADEHRGEATPENGAVGTVPLVVHAGEAADHEAHEIRKPTFEAADQQVEVVAHQTVCVNFDGISLGRCPEPFQKCSQSGGLEKISWPLAARFMTWCQAP